MRGRFKDVCGLHAHGWMCMGNGREGNSIVRGDWRRFSWRFDGDCVGCIAGILIFVQIVV